MINTSYSQSAKTQRIFIWSGIGLLTVYFAILALMMGFIPPPSPSLSPEEVVSLYSEHNVQFRIGVAIALFTGGGYLLWSLAISAQMIRHEEGIPLWAILQALSGAIGTIFIWGPALLWGVAAYSVSRDSSITIFIHQFAWLTFITPLTVFTLQIVAVIVIAFRAKDETTTAFPRWLGYFSVFFLVSSEVGVAPIIFNDGPFAWGGLPFYIPFGLFGLWIPAVMYCLLKAIKLQENFKID